jgi:spermidine/putrescine-binding protein
MKKKILTLAAAGLLLTGCGSTEPESSAASRAYIPADSVIQMNMQTLGYQVTLNDMTEQTGISMLAATNGKTPEDGFEGLYVIRANNPDTLESYKQTQQYDKQIDHFRYILYTNDAEYGNIMVCGTEKALSDAGVTGGN